MELNKLGLARDSSSTMGNEMSQPDNKLGRRVRSERVYSTATLEDESTRNWSHREVVINRLACGRRTSDQLRTIIESSLDEYFERESKKDWAVVIKKVAVTLPHGHYELKPELYETLQPDIYPYDDEEDRKYVIGKVKEHQESPQPQGINRRPILKRRIVTDSEDEEEVKPAEKKAKVETKANIVQKHAYDTFTSQPLSESRSPLGSVITTQASAKSQQSDFASQITNVTDLETNSEHDLDSFLENVKKSTFVREIKDLTNHNSKLQRRLKEVEQLKFAAVKLQHKASTNKADRRAIFQKWLDERKEDNCFIQEKDKENKQLRVSISEKDLRIARLEEALRKANAANQSHGKEAQKCQKLQQELSEKNGQIRTLNLRVDQEKLLRAAADRRADESVKASQKAGQQHREVLRLGKIEYQRALALKQRLDSTENKLKAAQLREQSYLVEDERWVLERRAAIQQRGDVENGK